MMGHTVGPGLSRTTQAQPPSLCGPAPVPCSASAPSLLCYYTDIIDGLILYQPPGVERWLADVLVVIGDYHLSSTRASRYSSTDGFVYVRDLDSTQLIRYRPPGWLDLHYRNSFVSTIVPRRSKVSVIVWW